MSLKSVFVGCLTALLGVATTGCATPAAEQKDTSRVANNLPDYSVTDPKTGCRSFKDEKNPDKPQQCIINELPKPTVK